MTAPKPPWQMTRAEWNAEREKSAPNTAQSRFTRSSGSEAVRKFERFMFLRYDARPSDGYAVRHRDVIAKALSERRTVPAEVLAEYPELVTP